MGAAITNRQRQVRVSARRLAASAERALAALGRAGEDVEIDVVDDVEIRRLNALHRGIRRRTDVLSFPMEIPESAGRLVGQVVISAETAERQARRLGVPLAQEMDLLLTHGVLHLVGYDDRDPVEADLMHRRERDILTSGRRRMSGRLWTGLLHE
jgi:probable rRNA maturation factor